MREDQPDHKLDLSRVSREALEALAQACHEENGERAESARARIRAEATATLCYEGDCAKMTGRARPCPVHDTPAQTAEIRARLEAELVEAYRLLELEKAKDGDTWKERAVTERAARERAEKEAAQYKLWFDETAKSHDATNAHLERAEHERNEHAKHRANLDRKNQELSRENERLVDYASGCQRERDTALARVKELENDLEIANQHFRARVAELEAAETALASARELLERAHRWVAGPVIRRDVEAWLTSHPAPVAAPRSESRCALSINGQHDWYCKLCMPTPVAAAERGKRDVVETAIDLTKDDKRSRWNEPGELPVTVMATSEHPSPAPCSGCAAARELLASIVTYAREDRAETPGVTRLARALVRAEAWLKEHP